MEWHPELDQFSDEARETILKSLERQGVDDQCRRCHKTAWSMPNRYMQLIHEEELAPVKSVIESGFESMPFALHVCTNCGYAALHSAQVLTRAADESEADNR